MQKTVSLYPVVGLPGQEVNAHTAVYTPFNYISDGTAAAGSFVFVKANSDENGGVVYPIASATGSGTVIGLVEHTFTGALAYNEEGTLVYPQGANLTIAVRGDYYVAASGAATVGQAVLCDPSNGAITYGTPGTANDTGWVVMTPATDAGEIIVISNRGVSVASAAAAAAASVDEGVVGESTVGA